MEKLLADIAEAVRERGQLDAKSLGRIIAVHNRRFAEPMRHFTKKQLTGAYRRIKRDNSDLWASWGLTDDDERALLASIQVKPRRTASGVATITVITKPHPCAGRCLYCPNDVRMPKSYLHDEPACQRAERSCFDPYLQVASRLAALENMGHATDKVELIVLGGSFTDYPTGYQTWFVHELFRALNDAEGGCVGVADVFAAKREPDASLPAEENGEPASLLAQEAAKRMVHYRDAGISFNADALVGEVAAWQQRVDAGLPYNEAIEALYGSESPWQAAAAWQVADLAALEHQQCANEHAGKRMVGLVVETRPDAVDVPTLINLRQLGCTKLQLGVQTLDAQVAHACNRPLDKEALDAAFELVRAFGFKSHAHFMANLPGATPETDAHDYRAFVTDEAIAPDEVKLYPCVLLPGTGLVALHDQGRWQPYGEPEMVELLAADLAATPPHTRISRMIRDFSSHDIVAGNKKTNLRQMVEARTAELVAQGAPPVQEIRAREIATDDTCEAELEMVEERYRTSNTQEVFIQWVLPTRDGSPAANRIAGFARLSLPDRDWIEAHADLPVSGGQAMIREVHVYGAAARLHAPTSGAQHRGLGRALVARACQIAHEAGCRQINVISAVGTREYYRNLGFTDAGLYLVKSL